MEQTPHEPGRIPEGASFVDLVGYQLQAIEDGDDMLADEAYMRLKSLHDAGEAERVQPETGEYSDLVANPLFLLALDIQHETYHQPASTERDAKLGAIENLIRRFKRQHDQGRP